MKTKYMTIVHDYVVHTIILQGAEVPIYQTTVYWIASSKSVVSERVLTTVHENQAWDQHLEGIAHANYWYDNRYA